jgi:hypothetical protein
MNLTQYGFEVVGRSPSQEFKGVDDKNFSEIMTGHCAEALKKCWPKLAFRLKRSGKDSLMFEAESGEDGFVVNITYSMGTSNAFVVVQTYVVDENKTLARVHTWASAKITGMTSDLSVQSVRSEIDDVVIKAAKYVSVGFTYRKRKKVSQFLQGVASA